VCGVAAMRGRGSRGARPSRCCVLVAFSSLNDTEFLIRHTSTYIVSVLPSCMPSKRRLWASRSTFFRFRVGGSRLHPMFEVESGVRGLGPAFEVQRRPAFEVAFSSGISMETLFEGLRSPHSWVPRFGSSI